MKICSTCKQSKDESEFPRDKSKKDGLNSRCKACRKADWKAYLETKQGRDMIHRALARYRRTQKGKESRTRQRLSEKGKAVQFRYNEKRKLNNRDKAGTALHNAIRSGKIPHISTRQCLLSYTGECEGRMEYHHPSYAPEHWLDVIPLCKKHHVLAHGLPYNDLWIPNLLKSSW